MCSRCKLCLTFSLHSFNLLQIDLDCVCFQVWDGLSSGQAAALSHAGPHQSQPPTGFLFLRDQSACSTLPTLFPLHEVSGTYTRLVSTLNEDISYRLFVLLYINQIINSIILFCICRIIYYFYYIINICISFFLLIWNLFEIFSVLNLCINVC